MHDARKEAYGRLSSIMSRVGNSLEWLHQSRQTLRRLPEIDQANPTIVVCGAPNVGKRHSFHLFRVARWKLIIIHLQQNNFTLDTLSIEDYNIRW